MRTLKSRLKHIEQVNAQWRKHEKRFGKYRRAYLTQEERCFYCGQIMLTGWTITETRSPSRVTREHLFSRNQMEERRANPGAVVLACAQCNHRRADRPWQLFMLESVKRVWGKRPNARRRISEGAQVILLALVMGGSKYHGPITRDFCVEWRAYPTNIHERAIRRFVVDDEGLFLGRNGERPIMSIWVGHRITRPCLGDASGAF